MGVYSKFFRYFEHIFPGFFVIVTDNSIQYRLFNCIFDIPDSFTGRQMESGDDFFTADGGELEFYPAKKNGELVGTAVKTYTNNGFGGKIWLMVGFNPDGSVANYSVLEHKETPGLGSKMDLR